MRKLLWLLTALTTSACSLYQSEGRKFLEKQAFEFAGASAQQFQTACNNEGSSRAWVKISETAHATVFVHDSDGFELRVFPIDDPSGFHCDYSFPSAQEMFEKTEAAVDLTIAMAHSRSL